jgi:hypothetical protein
VYHCIICQRCILHCMNSLRAPCITWHITLMSTRLVHLAKVLSQCGEGMHPLILYSLHTRHQVHKAPLKPLLKPSFPQAWVQTHPGYNQVKIPSSLPSVFVYLLQSIYFISAMFHYASQGELKKKGWTYFLNSSAFSLQYFCSSSYIF